jgi:hypothetical protein
MKDIKLCRHPLRAELWEARVFQNHREKEVLLSNQLDYEDNDSWRLNIIINKYILMI